MTELLCIQTHSQKAVIAGNTYPLIAVRNPCGCTGCYDVGVPISASPNYNGNSRTRCSLCGTMFYHKGVWWICKSLFAPIATEDEVKEQILIEHE